MINAGRILIMPRGDWDNLTTYDMLDLVSYNSVAYLARQQSVGINPATDTSLTYWQPFGSASSIATTTSPGLVMPDGTTITIDVDGRIEIPIDNSTIKIDELTGKLVAIVTPTAAGTSYNNASSGLVATNVQAAIDEVVTDLNGKADASDIPTALSDLTDDATHRLVTDTEKSTWNAKPSDLDGLSDVTLTSPTSGQALRHNGSGWVNAEALHKTTAQSCVIGDTTVTFTDANILTTSEIWPHADTASGTPVPFTSCVVSVDGTAVLTFPALTEAASIYLKITNY